MWLSPHNARALPTTDAYKLVWSYNDTDESMGGKGVKRGGLEPCLKSTDGNLSAKPSELVEAITNQSYVYYGLYKRKFGISEPWSESAAGVRHGVAWKPLPHATFASKHTQVSAFMRRFVTAASRRFR
jgi:hypothetical protein